MEKFIKGDVVVIPFPFSDLTGSKKRPALVLADLPGDDILLCQITSQFTKDSFAIPFTNKDFLVGSLPSESNIRPSRIFTADKNIIERKTGTINDIIFKTVVQKIIDIIQK